MAEDNSMPNFWWCPTHHLYRGGDKRPCADAVRLVLDLPALNADQHAERLDRVLWLWAEEKWRREQLLAQRQQWWDTVGREKAALTEQRNLAVWLHAEAVWLHAEAVWHLGKAMSGG